MRCLIITSTFIFFIIQFSQGIENYPARVEVKEGGKVDYTILEADYNIISCIAVHDNQVYSIYPKSNLTNAVNESTGKLCIFKFSNVSLSDAGKWTIYTTFLSDSGISKSTYLINIYVYVKTTLLPTNWLISEIGNYVTVFPQYHFPNFTSCSVKLYNYGLFPDTYDLLNLKQDDLGIERYGICGVRIRVDESRYGTWELIQNDGPYKIIELEFKIWKSYGDDYGYNKNLVWHHGLSAEIGLPEYLRYSYCKITQPDGRYTIFEFCNCTKKIDKVDYIHEGVWEIQYYDPEHFDVITKQFRVKLKDELKTHDNMSISLKTENNKTHLLCTLSGVTSEFCLFTKPDGSILNIPQGIGNDKYEYYGKGYNYNISELPHSDCGLTIYQPFADDFGLWECLLGRNRKSHQNYSAFISFIDTNTISMTGAYVPNHFHVKRGDNFQIECPRYASLNYCWLYSPNGTIYARSNHINSKTASLFKDRDLAAGICGTIIENANDEHSGNWSCLLNVVGGDEIKVSNAIVVSVTDSYLYANQNVIKMNKNEKTNLTLSILPEKYVTIVYCRWHHPNGTEVQRKNSSQYSISHNQKSCSLIINEYNAENIGKWTCYAGLLDDSDGEVFNKEISATVTVIENENDF